LLASIADNAILLNGLEPGRLLMPFMMPGFTDPMDGDKLLDLKRDKPMRLVDSAALVMGRVASEGDNALLSMSVRHDPQTSAMPTFNQRLLVMGRAAKPSPGEQIW
jgi:hypothetical protein